MKQQIFKKLHRKLIDFLFKIVCESTYGKTLLMNRKLFYVPRGSFIQVFDNGSIIVFRN